MHKDAQVNKSFQKYTTFNKSMQKINKNNAKNVKAHNRTEKIHYIGIHKSTKKSTKLTFIVHKMRIKHLPALVMKVHLLAQTGYITI